MVDAAILTEATVKLWPPEPVMTLPALTPDNQPELLSTVRVTTVAPFVKIYGDPPEVTVRVRWGLPLLRKYSTLPTATLTVLVADWSTDISCPVVSRIQTTLPVLRNASKVQVEVAGIGGLKVTMQFRSPGNAGPKVITLPEAPPPHPLP